MKPTKEKIKPPIIATREGFQASVGRYVNLGLELSARRTEMEQAIAAIQGKFQKRLDDLAQQLDAEAVAIELWCSRNKTEFTERKSIELATATVGYRTTPPRVEKLNPKDTWERIAMRLEALGWGEDYVTTPRAVVDKSKLLDHRIELKADQLVEAGIAFAQDEEFYIKPKSEVLDAVVKEAA